MRRVQIKRKSLFFLVLSVLVVFLIKLTFVQASDTDETPDWLKRTEFSVQLETDQKPRLYFQTVQPLYQDPTKENTIFIQPRASSQEGDLTYNLGIGYRKLASENLILGINIFGDYQARYSHGRTGIGLEALGQVLEARVNTYIGTTEQREVQQGSGSTTYERVANGADYELGSVVPYLPWLKVYGSGFWYDFNNFDDRVGWKSRIEAKLNDSLRLEFFTFDDNKGDQEYGGRLRFLIAFHDVFDIWDGLKRSKEAFPKKDLREELLIPVERNHEIVVERFIRQGGLTVEAGRV